MANVFTNCDVRNKPKIVIMLKYNWLFCVYMNVASIP